MCVSPHSTRLPSGNPDPTFGQGLGAYVRAASGTAKKGGCSRRCEHRAGGGPVWVAGQGPKCLLASWPVDCAPFPESVATEALTGMYCLSLRSDTAPETAGRGSARADLIASPHCEGVRQQLHHLPLGAPKGWPLTAEGARPACCARGEQGCWGAGRALRFASPQLLPALPVVQVGSRAGSAVLAAPCVLSHVWEKARGREGWSESAGVASADRQQVLRGSARASHCP